MWFNLAASRGNAEAARERDTLAARMTPQQVAIAQERASAWRPDPTPEAAAPQPLIEDVGPPPVRALREAQTLLAALGYAPGPADGVWGPRSVRAYQSFLRDAGLPPADILTPDTLQRMRDLADVHGVDPSVIQAGPSPAPQAVARLPHLSRHRRRRPMPFTRPPGQETSAACRLYCRPAWMWAPATTAAGRH